MRGTMVIKWSAAGGRLQLGRCLPAVLEEPGAPSLADARRGGIGPIRSDRDAALERGAESRLAHPVAYEQRIEAVSTWPFDVATWLRFALYVSVGLGSWLCAAVVERALGSVLD